MTAPDPFALGGQADKDAEEGGDHAELAAIEFEPLQDIEKLFAAFGAVEWKKTTQNVGIDCRLAAVTLGKTKPELIKAARDMLADETGEGTAFWELVDRFTATQKWCAGISAMLGDARARLMVGAYTIASEPEKAGAGGEGCDCE